MIKCGSFAPEPCVKSAEPHARRDIDPDSERCGSVVPETGIVTKLRHALISGTIPCDGDAFALHRFQNRLRRHYGLIRWSAATITVRVANCGAGRRLHRVGA